MKVKFKRFSSLARVPTKSTPDSAYYDVYSATDILLGPGATNTVELDLGFKFAKKYVCRIYGRSGLSLKPLLLGGYRGGYRFRLQRQYICYSYQIFVLEC